MTAVAVRILRGVAVTGLEALMSIDGIPFIVDESFDKVMLLRAPPRPHRHWGLGYVSFPRDTLVGSTSAWGAYYAHNLAMAYKPEGVP